MQNWIEDKHRKAEESVTRRLKPHIPVFPFPKATGHDPFDEQEHAGAHEARAKNVGEMMVSQLKCSHKFKEAMGVGYSTVFISC